MRARALLTVVFVVTAAACSRSEAPPSSSPAAASSSTSAAWPTHLSRVERDAAAHVTAAAISGPLRFLSDDLLEGRGPGTRGSDLAIQYIADEMQTMGLAPGGDGGGWLQKVPLV